MTVALTNLISNGSAEVNVTGWNGYYTSGGQLTLSTQAPVRSSNATPTPPHGEYGSWCFSHAGQAQGAFFLNPSAAIATVIGHKYYIRSRVRLRSASNNEITSVVTVVNANSPTENLPSGHAATAPPPFSDGLQATDTTQWVLIDSIWTADRTTLIPRWIGQTTSVQGNNRKGLMCDNIVILNLTTSFGAGLEPPLVAIRGAINTYEGANGGHGYFDGTVTVTMPTAPIISTASIPTGLTNRSYSTQIALQQDTGTAPFTFSLSGLPAGHGLSISNTGDITGTLTLGEGQYNLIVTVTDTVGFETSRNLTFNVGTPPQINNTYIPGAIYNQPYSFSADVTGSSDDLAIVISVISGTLPTGLSIVGSSISGTATVDGQSCTIRIYANNIYGEASADFALGVYSAPRINTTTPLANGILGSSYSVQFTAAGVTPMTWEALDPLPDGLSFTSAGLLSGTPNATGAFSFNVRATNDLGSDTRLYYLTINQLPVITTTTLGYARLGSAYSAQLFATGTQPITFSQTGGSLPTGLQLNANGSITGTPLATGTFTFYVIATNAAGSSSPISLQIQAGNALAIVTTSPLPNGTVSTPYSGITFQAAGIDGSYSTTWSWSAQSGSSFPPGLSLNGTTGVLSGTPSALGTFNVNVTVTNGVSNSTSPFTITVGSPPVITSNLELGGGIYRPFSITLQATGTQPITWRMVGESSPATNITINSQGICSWLIPEIGNYTFIAIATNAFGDSAPAQFTLTITTPSIIDVYLPMGIVDEFWTYTFTASGEPPFTWTMPSGSLPNGLSWNAETATISGIPTTTGVSNFNIRTTNIGGYAEESFQIEVDQRPLILTQALNSGNVSAAYSQTLTASGTTPITWSILPHTGSETGLPAGLSLVGATISGTPSIQGLYSFTVRASNVTGVSYVDDRQFTIQINASNAPVITTNAIQNAVLGIPFSLSLAATNSPTAWHWGVGLVPSGQLPPGLGLDGNIIAGTPTTAGTYRFMIEAGNSYGYDERIITLIVNVAPTITTVLLPNGSVGELYSEQLTATGDTPLTWQIISPIGSETGLPIGMFLNSVTGIISGTPVAANVYTFRINVYNASGNDVKSFELEIVGGLKTFINGKEVDRLFINGNEVAFAYVNGEKIFG